MSGRYVRCRWCNLPKAWRGSNRSSVNLEPVAADPPRHCSDDKTEPASHAEEARSNGTVGEGGPMGRCVTNEAWRSSGRMESRPDDATARCGVAVDAQKQGTASTERRLQLIVHKNGPNYLHQNRVHAWRAGRVWPGQQHFWRSHRPRGISVLASVGLSCDAARLILAVDVEFVCAICRIVKSAEARWEMEPARICLISGVVDHHGSMTYRRLASTLASAQARRPRRTGSHLWRGQSRCACRPSVGYPATNSSHSASLFLP